MKWFLCAMLILFVASPCFGQFVAIQGGLGLPTGDFANPPSEDPVQRGAKTGLWCEGAYLHQLGPVHLKAAILFVSCAEKEKTFTSVGTVAGFRHEFVALTGGIEKQFYSHRTVRPLISISGGAFNYKTRLVDDSGSSDGESDFAVDEYHFKWLTRFGTRAGAALVYEVVPDLVQLRIGAEYTLVFTGEIEGFLGFEGGARKQNYPYAYPSKRIDFWTISLGFVFHPQ